jgi:hypothetical protein
MIKRKRSQIYNKNDSDDESVILTKRRKSSYRKKNRVVSSDDESTHENTITESESDDSFIVSDSYCEFDETITDSDEYNTHVDSDNDSECRYTSIYDLIRIKYIEDEINGKNDSRRSTDNITEKCKDWIKKEYPKEHSFVECINTDYLFGQILQNNVTMFEIPQKKCEEISDEEGICDICNSTKTLSMKSELTIKLKDGKYEKRNVKFGKYCGLKVRLAYLYGIIIEFIKNNKRIKDEKSIIEIFEGLRNEYLKNENQKASIYKKEKQKFKYNKNNNRFELRTINFNLSSNIYVPNKY